MKSNDLLRDPETGKLIINDALDKYQAEIIAEIDSYFSNRIDWDLNPEGTCWVYNHTTNNVNKITWVCRFLSSQNGKIIQGNNQPNMQEQLCIYDNIKELVKSGRLAP